VTFAPPAITLKNTLTATKTQTTANPVSAGGSVTYVVGFTLVGPSDAHGVTVNDPAPVAGMVLTGITINSNPDGFLCNVGTATCSALAAKVSNGGDTFNFTYSIPPTVTVPPFTAPATAPTFVNTVTVKETNPLTTKTATVTTTINPGANLIALTVANAPTFLAPGEYFVDPAKYGVTNQPLEVDFGIHNGGPITATGVVVTANFPAGTSFAAVTSDTPGVKCLTPESTPPSTPPNWIPGQPFSIICSVPALAAVPTLKVPGPNLVIRTAIYFPENFTTVPPQPASTVKIVATESSLFPIPANGKTQFTTSTGGPATAPAPSPLPGFTTTPGSPGPGGTNGAPPGSPGPPGVGGF